VALDHLKLPLYSLEPVISIHGFHGMRESRRLEPANHHPPRCTDDAPGVSTERLDDASSRGLKSVLERKLSQPLLLPGQPLAPHPWNDQVATWRPHLDVTRNFPPAVQQQC
jgi:hypothetical protein